MAATASSRKGPRRCDEAPSLLCPVALLLLLLLPALAALFSSSHHLTLAKC